jgi:hypothetical protein
VMVSGQAGMREVNCGRGGPEPVYAKLRRPQLCDFTRNGVDGSQEGSPRSWVVLPKLLSPSSTVIAILAIPPSTYVEVFHFLPCPAIDFQSRIEPAESQRHLPLVAHKKPHPRTATV